MNRDEEKKWLSEYFDLYQQAIFATDVRKELLEVKELFQKCHGQGKKIIFIGNGGSAAMASHCAVDFTKNAGVRCINFNEADLITCFANDFGYEKCFQKALEFYADAGDVVVLVSSSGKSANILRAGEYAKEAGLTLVTLTGFGADSPLAALGNINLSLNSRAYNVIEMVHQIWLLAICDLIIGKAEYPA
ncbi:MAG: SIS domain-containing protein [Deltaproteobacteria bacterium]|nr:SIS domain-containing protein [Deltaproteobacteria bacterium]